LQKYLYKRFQPTEEYRQKVIEMLRHNTNVEIGGYKIYDGTGTHYMQNPVEITDFVFAAKKQEKKAGRKFESFLEIGFSAGINNTFLNKMFGFSHIVTVDIVTPAGINPAAMMANMRFKNLTFLCGSSHDHGVIERARKLGDYDVIFIDADHSFEAVKKDFNNYHGMLNPGGVLALHDIHASDHPGPGRFWKELRASAAAKHWTFTEFHDKGQYTEYGIGMMLRKS